MDNVSLIKLTDEHKNEVYVNCDKVLYMSIDNATSHTLTVIHMHGQTNVKVRENMRWVASKLKCPDGH